MLEASRERSLAVTARLRQRLKEAEYSYEERPELIGAASLLEFLRVLVSDSERRVAERFSSAQGQPDDVKEAAKGVIVEETRTVRNAVESSLAVLSRSHGRAFDPFVSPFSRIAALLAPSTEMLVVPLSGPGQYHVTYPLNPRLVRGNGSENESAQGAILVGGAVREKHAALPTLVVLRYPETAEVDSFQHFMLGHEIAHLRLRRDGGELVRTALSEFQDKRSAEFSAVPIERRLGLPERVDRWFAELAADWLGLKIVGPGLFFTLFEDASLNVWQYDPDLEPQKSDYNRYPALAWRLSRLAAQVSDDYIPESPPAAVSEETPEGSATHAWSDDEWAKLRDRFVQLRDQIPEWRDDEAGVEYAIVDAALQALTAQPDLLPQEPRVDPDYRTLTAPNAALAELLAQDSHYEPAKFHRDIPIVWAKLNTDIAPAERLLFRGASSFGLGDKWAGDAPWSLPLDWRSIVNVTYLHWALNKGASAEEAVKTRENASRVARTGVELSEIQLAALALRDEMRALGEPEAT